MQRRKKLQITRIRVSHKERLSLFLLPILLLILIPILLMLFPNPLPKLLLLITVVPFTLLARNMKGNQWMRMGRLSWLKTRILLSTDLIRRLVIGGGNDIIIY